MQLTQKKKALSWSRRVKDRFDGLQRAAETICCARSAALLPEEMLQEGRGLSGEQCPGQAPRPVSLANHFSSPEHLLPSKNALREMLMTHAGVVCGEETPYSKRDTLAQNRFYPANGLAGFTRGFALSRFHPHEAIEFIFFNTCKGIFKAERENKDCP